MNIKQLQGVYRSIKEYIELRYILLVWFKIQIIGFKSIKYEDLINFYEEFVM